MYGFNKTVSLRLVDWALANLIQTYIARKSHQPIQSTTDPKPVISGFDIASSI